MKKRILISLKLAISILLLYLLFRETDLDFVKKSILSAEIHLILLALATMTVNRFLMGYKWNLLLKAQQVYITSLSATKIYYSSTFMGLFLPATVGADASRAYLVKRMGHSLSKTISSIVVERLIGFVVLLTFVFLGCGLYASQNYKAEFKAQDLFALALAIFVILICMAFLPFFPSVKKLTSKTRNSSQSEKRASRILDKLTGLLYDYQSFKDYKLTIAIFTGLTVIDNISMIIWVYFVGLSLSVSIPLIYLITFIPLITFASRLPISINGFGIHEGGFVYFLTLLGHSSETALGVGLANHLLMIISVVPGAFFISLPHPKAKNSINPKDN